MLQLSVAVDKCNISVMPRPRRLPQFTNRDEELARLEQLILIPKPRIHAAVVGLRRTGKTVLLEEFAARHERDHIVALVEADDAANGLEAWLLHVVAALVGAAGSPPRDVQPEAAAIRVAAAALDAAVRVRVEELLALLGRKRQDGYGLFASPLRFAQQLAQETGRDLILAIDEFPGVLDFKKLPGLNRLEGIIRALAEHESPDVFFVITGSAIRQMHALLSGDAPLLTRFEEIRLHPFTPRDAETLLDRMLEARRSTIEPYARDELLRTAHGHPFYISRLVTRAADLADQSGRHIATGHFHDAFHLEAIDGSGHVAKACQWIFENSLGPKGDAGRDLLLELARADGPARPSDLNAHLGWPRSKLSRQIEALVQAELIVRHDEGEADLLSFTDPIFALWLARRTGKIGPVQDETIAGLRKIVAQLGADFGKPYEAYALIALANFDGKGWPAALFGVTDRKEIVVPRFAFDEIEQNPTMFDGRGIVHEKPSSIEVEAYAPGSEGWLVEVKAERIKATKGELEELERCAIVFGEDRKRRIDRLWFVAREGFHEAAVSYAEEKGIYITRGTQLKEIRRLQAERAATRRRPAARRA